VGVGDTKRPQRVKTTQGNAKSEKEQPNMGRKHPGFPPKKGEKREETEWA